MEGKDILLIEDVVDTGLSVKCLKDEVLSKKPRSLKICCLLNKPAKRKFEIDLDYVGFTIPAKFVVGYGLDCKERFRNLPYLGFIELVRPILFLLTKPGVIMYHI